MVMLQSNSLTFFNVPKIFYKLYFCKKILTRADISFQVGGAVSYLKNILSQNKLNAFNTNIGNNIVGVFFNFVKEFENKIGAFIAVSMRLLKNNFHCSTNLPNCQERKELTTTTFRKSSYEPTPIQRHFTFGSSYEIDSFMNHES